MANFFSKKAPATKVSVQNTNNEGYNPSDNQSEFSRTFKPFLVKKDVQLASVNWFRDKKSKSKGNFVPRTPRKEVITIDDDDDDGDDGDIVMVEPPAPTLNVSTMEAKGP
jgi:chromatin assembly factor 1 subunit A